MQTRDKFSPELRSRVMAAVHSSGNRSTEGRLRQALKKAKLWGWKTQAKELPGSPDFVFAREKIAVFVDGCFWHGCKNHCRIPSNNQDYWLTKINRNKTKEESLKPY